MRILKVNFYAYRNAWQHLGQRNKGILLPLHRHRLQQEQNHLGTQFAGLTGTKVQTPTLLLLLQAIDWVPDAKGSYATHSYLTLIRCACISHTQVQILPLLLLLQALVWMPGARASSLPVYLL